MEEKKLKIKLSTIIIIVLVLVIILMVAICANLYFKNEELKKSNNPQITNNIPNRDLEVATPNTNTNTNANANTNATIPDENLNSNTVGNSTLNQNSNEILDLNNNNLNTNTNVNNNTNVNTNNNLNTNTNQNAGSIQTQISSKVNPLSIGQWGIASKYSDGQYVNVPVKVSNIIRGTQASQLVKDYCDTGHSIYKYTEPDEGCEWVVAEYNIDLTNVKAYATNTKSLDITANIVGSTSTSNSVIYNNKWYSITSTAINKSNDTAEPIGTGYISFQMPIGCTDYLIQLGVYNNTQAFFKGQ